MDVKALCLGVLSRGAASGYEIKKQCEEGPFAHFYAAGFGSIYPALNALLDAGLISLEEVVQQGRPSKKVYTITATGRLALTRALTQAPAPDRLRSDFLFITFFGQLMPARQIDAVLQQRIELLRERVAEMKRCLAENMPGGEEFTLGYGIVVYEAAIDYIERHRHELVGASLRNEIGGVRPPEQRTPTADIDG